MVSNISEGEARRTRREKRRYYEIACSSIVEIDAQVEISLELEIISHDEIEKLSELVDECFAMLSKLRKKR